MADVSEEIMKRNNLKGSDVDWLVPHQANLRLDATAKRMNVSPNKVMINIQNTAIQLQQQFRCVYLTGKVS